MVKLKNINFLGMNIYQPKADEVYMNQDQLVHFTSVLTHWYQSLQSDASGLMGMLQTDALLIDPLDRASYEENQRMELRASDRRRKLQAKIESALDNIKGCCYGYCKTCGSEIGLERLEVRPTADECIRCKTVAEIQEKRCVG